MGMSEREKMILEAYIGGNQRERPGLIEAGNIDLQNRPRVKNADGSISTVRSMGFHDGKNEVLVPTVSDDGRIMADKEAMEYYRKSGRHLGKFKDVDSSNAYAESLHNDQAKLIDPQAKIKGFLGY